MGDGAVNDLFKADEIPEAAPFFYAIEPSGFNLAVGLFHGLVVFFFVLANLFHGLYREIKHAEASNSWFTWFPFNAPT